MAYNSVTFKPSLLRAIMMESMEIAREAGTILMEHYNAHCNDENYLQVTAKSDSSPVTAADKASHNHITSQLPYLTSHPIISEENKEHPDVSGGVFWTVDPLDGTKGFINKNDHFYVKIALIENAQPIMGVIYEPVYDRFHYSMTGAPSYEKQGSQEPKILKTRQASQKGQLSTLFNGLHYDKAAYKAARQVLVSKGVDAQDLKEANGACKKAFHMSVASGEADIYLDCGRKTSLLGGNGYSWDYAPDALIVPNAGGAMLEIATGRPPRFDRPTERMNAMVVLGDSELAKKLIP